VDDDRDPFDDPRLTEAVDDLRAAFLTAPDDDVARRHLDRLRATPVGVVPLRRRRPTVAAAAVAGLATAVLGLGGVAAANGSLPRPLQAGVSALVGVVGIEIPDGDGGGEGVGEREPAEVPPVPPVLPDLPAPGPPVVDPGPGEGAPGRDGEIPGREDTAPGRTGTAGETTNQPEAPPGQTGDVGNKPEEPPGQTGDVGNKPEAPPGLDRAPTSPPPSSGGAPAGPGSAAPGRNE
jgi:hypothetical protein